MKIKIEGGRLYDPRNNLDGEERDIFIENGIIVDRFSSADKTINASGKTIMAGGIDIHSHIATYGLNLIRGTGRFYSPREIGYIYAKMGYTHVNEPFMTQVTARYVHHELSSIPILDTSAFLVLNLRDVEAKIKSAKHLEEVEKIIPIIIAGTKAIGLKIYEPFVRYTQRTHILRNVTEKKVLSFFSSINREKIPRIILHTSPELFGKEIENPVGFHFSHVGSAIGNEEDYQKVLSYLNAGASVELGLFDFEQNLRISNPKQTVGEVFGRVDMGLSEDIVFSQGNASESETPFFAFKLALSQPSNHISFSTDSPANASFEAYPKIFSWLMKAENRANLFDKELPDFEYSLLDIARITRYNPAVILGFKNKGHLGAEAEADIAIYDINKDTKPDKLEAGFRDCACLIKSGSIVVEDHKIVNDQAEKKTYYRGVETLDYEPAKILAGYSTFRFENLMVDEVFTAKEVKI